MNAESEKGAYDEEPLPSAVEMISNMKHSLSKLTEEEEGNDSRPSNEIAVGVAMSPCPPPRSNDKSTALASNEERKPPPRHRISA